MGNLKKLKIASAQYPIEHLANWKAFENKLSSWVADAINNGAQMLIFPEYAAMELVSLLSEIEQRDLSKQLSALQSFLPKYMAHYQHLAVTHQIIIVSGSFPVLEASDIFLNRCHVFFPDGNIKYQDKRMMTRFERERWQITAGNNLQTYNSEFGKFGILICYDAEFPLLARQLVEIGATLLIVPSCTDAAAGYNRVRIAAQARALENQCYVVQSATIGNAPWSIAVDENYGAAGVFAPPDVGFPSDGVVAMGALNEPQWLYATLDPKRLNTVRTKGQVLNFQDWNQQLDINKGLPD